MTVINVDNDRWEQHATLTQHLRDLAVWARYLREHALKARTRVRRADSVGAMLEGYGMWLKRFHEARGAIDQLCRDCPRLCWSDAEIERLSRLIRIINEIRDDASGSAVWLSLPSHERTKDCLTRLLTSLASKLEEVGRAA
jgi:hypothetical protein